MRRFTFATSISTANRCHDARITVHVSETDVVTTTPHLRQPVRIVATGGEIVAGTSYRILRAYATLSMPPSGSEDGVGAISTVDVVTAPSDARVTREGTQGAWDAEPRPDADDGSDVDETVYGGQVATRLFVQPATDEVPVSLAGLEATLGASDRLLRGKRA